MVKPYFKVGSKVDVYVGQGDLRRVLNVKILRVCPGSLIVDIEGREVKRSFKKYVVETANLTDKE